MKDKYTDENGVLKNLLNIKSAKELKQAEADIGFVKLINIDSIFIDKFDENLIKSIHRHIFEDIYEWAGEYRTVPLVKEEVVLPGYSIPYSEYKNIGNDLRQKLNELNSIAWQNMDVDEISLLYARKIALLWRVHPFRDGNTRTMLSFSFLYAKEHGFPFDIKVFINELNRKKDENGKILRHNVRDKFVLACLDEKDYPEVQYLASIFKYAIKTYREEHKDKKCK